MASFFGGVDDLVSKCVKNDDLETHTSLVQEGIEKKVTDLLSEWLDSPSPECAAQLWRSSHVSYLRQGLDSLPEYFVGLDASRTWICFWILHSLDLMQTSSVSDLSDELRGRCVSFLARCQHSSGGFGGGPGQEAHLATTYAAISALLTIGTPEAFELIDRRGLYEYLLRMKQPDGSFTVHEGGEMDIRGIYTALASAAMANVLSPRLTANCASWMASAQTYEGGFGGEPGNEAHGGYTYCGLASLVLCGGDTSMINLKSLTRWAARRQTTLAGGFQGRTNKLVDGCYSWWVGGVFPLLHELISGEKSRSGGKWLFNQSELQKWLLVCCQSPHGGLRDKPGKGPDFYHTCYCLSGLSMAQNQPNQTRKDGEFVAGMGSNRLRATNPVFNVCDDKLERSIAFFGSLPSADELLEETK